MIRAGWRLARPLAYSLAAAVLLATSIALEIAARRLEARGLL
jgi:hypothetical protein